MLSIERTRAAVVACYASPPALDSLTVVSAGTHACRVASDELLLIVPPSVAAETERRAVEHFAAVEPTALVVDQSDGCSMFSLRGDQPYPSLLSSRRSLFPVERPAFVQGAVAEGSAKILLCDGAIHVLVPSTLRHHVAARLYDVCGTLAMVPDAETAFVSDARFPSPQAGAATPALR